MDEAMKDRLAAYINFMEAVTCEEWHRDEWPECDFPANKSHDEGRAILEVIGRPAARPFPRIAVG